MHLANATPFSLAEGFYGAADEVDWFFERIEAGVTYADRSLIATTGAWHGLPGVRRWKGSGSTGKASAWFH